MKGRNLYSVLFLGLVGIALTIFLAVSVVPKVFVSWTKAAPLNRVSLVNSYFIGGKMLAKADGIEKCVVNVFVLDSNGKGISGQPVTVTGMMEDQQVVSGADGKASFEIVSEREGQYELSANIAGVPLGKTLIVTFRN